MKILLTGASGLLGRETHRLLVEKGHFVIPISKTRGDGLKVLRLDLNDEAALLNIQGDFDCIIHLAALVPSLEMGAECDSAFSNNVLTTLNLLNFATQKKIKKFIYGSSCSVYGSLFREGPVDEDDAKNPENHYALSKLAAETLLSPYEFCHAIECTALRFSYLYGHGMRQDTAVMRFMDLARENKPIPLFNGGVDLLDLLYVKDAALAIVSALLNPGGIFNIGSGKTVSVLELAQMAIDLKKSASKIDLKPVTGPQRRSYMSIDKAGRKLFWSPSYSLYDGFRDFMVSQ